MAKTVTTLPLARSLRLLVILLSLGLVLAACADDAETPVDGADTGQQAQERPPAGDGSPGEQPATPGGGGSDGGSEEPEAPAPVGEGSVEARVSEDFPSVTGRPAQLVAVRTASHPATQQHPAFDRVVLEFEGEQRPEWRIAYTDGPVRQDGSGHEVDIAGNAFLELRVVPASGVDLQGQEARQTYTGPDRIRLDGAVVTEAVRTGDFEAHLSWALGAERRAPFAIAWLEDPMRLVVDVMDADG